MCNWVHNQQWNIYSDQRMTIQSKEQMNAHDNQQRNTGHNQQVNIDGQQVSNYGGMNPYDNQQINVHNNQHILQMTIKDNKQNSACIDQPVPASGVASSPMGSETCSAESAASPQITVPVLVQTSCANLSSKTTVTQAEDSKVAAGVPVVSPGYAQRTLGIHHVLSPDQQQETRSIQNSLTPNQPSIDNHQGRMDANQHSMITNPTISALTDQMRGEGVTGMDMDKPRDLAQLNLPGSI